VSDAASTPPVPPASSGRMETPPPSHEAAAGSGIGSGAGVRSRTLRVVAAFLIVVSVVMFLGQMRKSREEPWRSPELAQARAKLLTDPKNVALKATVRQLDQDLRRMYFQRLERDRMGAWLLLGSGAVFVVLARMVSRSGEVIGLGLGLNRRSADGEPVSNGSRSGRAGASGPPVSWVAPDRQVNLRRAGLTLFAVTTAWVLALLGMGIVWKVRLPQLPDAAVAAQGGVVGATGEMGAAEVDVGRGKATSAIRPTLVDLARNWPRFRGMEGSGRLAEADVPLTWDTKTGAGVVWKAAVPLKGYSSPVIWNDHVFVTGGNREQRRVFAFDAATGEALWARPVTPTNAPAPVIDPPDQSGQAASTPATDGERVYAVFATGELGALDFAGNLVWHQRLDFKENGYGHAASLVVWNGRLLVQADQGAPEDGKSVLLALDVATGKTVWTAKRPVGGSWTTPIVIEAAGQPQVVTAGDPWLMGHNATTGAELWRAKVLGGELAPSPVFGVGKIFATSPGQALTAVSAEGVGDVTTTHVAWKLTEEVPDVPTPTLVGDLLYTANTEGLLICRDAGTGEKIWDHGFEVEIQASPLVVGERMYLFAQPGNVMVVKVGRTFESLATFEMGEDIYATPAMAGGRFLVRTARQLYCIGASGAPAKGETNDVR